MKILINFLINVNIVYIKNVLILIFKQINLYFQKILNVQYVNNNYELFFLNIIKIVYFSDNLNSKNYNFYHDKMNKFDMLDSTVVIINIIYKKDICYKIIYNMCIFIYKL